MRKHWAYAQYVIRHKWFVFLESCKLGIVWLGLTHDLSKFRLDEWIPYANYFYGKRHNVRDKTGYYKPTDTGDKAFDFAWLLHQKRNKHHWQWWCLHQDSDGIKVLEMPLRYRKEMLADWRGAGRTQGKPKTWEWYAVNKDKLQLAPETRAWVEAEIAKQERKYLSVLFAADGFTSMFGGRP